MPDIMDWQLTECDINKDIKVSDFLHVTGIKIHAEILDFCRKAARGARTSGNRCGLAVRFILKVAEESAEEG